MRKMLFFKLSILIFAACVMAEEPKEENGVLVLTKDNFDATLASKKFLLVEFYAPWCGHCKSLAPKYEAAAQALAAKDLKGVLAKVDATVETEVAAKFQVQGYPTLKFFKDGKFESDYDGDRSSDAIVAFISERADPNYKPPPAAVVTLTGANFPAFKADNDFFLLEFFAPWCGHCKSLAPEYEKAAKQLAKEDPPIRLAAVDATKEEALAKEFGVTGYPTLKLMRQGKAIDYKGPRNADGIVDYMVRNRKDAAVPVATVAEFQKNVPDKRPVVIGFFPDPNNALLKSYIEATNELREDFVVMLAGNAKLAEHFGLRPNTLAIIQPELLRSKYETGITIYDKTDATGAEVQNFLQKNSLPLVGHYTYDTSKYYDEANKDRALCLVFYSVDFSFDHRAATQLWRAKIADIANGFKDRVTFAVASDEEQEEKVREFGLGETGTDMNIGCKTAEGVKFAMPEMDEFEADHITGFVRAVLDGSAKPFLKSQPVPAKQTGDVKVVVADNFAQTVTDSPNDVLIEFYAPWCGHCKQLEPVYAALARRLQHVKTLTLAKMDATANDTPPGFKVEGFPTLYFKPSGSKQAFKLEGGRTEKDLLELLSKHAVASAPALQQEEKKKEEL